MYIYGNPKIQNQAKHNITRYPEYDKNGEEREDIMHQELKAN